MTQNAAAALLAARTAGKALAAAARTAGMTPEQAKAAGEGIRSIRRSFWTERTAAGAWEPVSFDPDNGEEFYDDRLWYWVNLRNKVTGEKYDVACNAGPEVLTDGEWHAHYRGQGAWTLAGARPLTLQEWRDIKNKAEGYLAANAELPTVEYAEADGCDPDYPEGTYITAHLTNGDTLDIGDPHDIGAQTWEVDGCKRYLTAEEVDIITEAYNDALQSAIDDLQDKIDDLERAMI